MNARKTTHEYERRCLRRMSISLEFFFQFFFLNRFKQETKKNKSVGTPSPFDGIEKYLCILLSVYLDIYQNSFQRIGF